MPFKAYLIGGAILVVVAAATVGYFIINGIIQENRVLTANNAKLTVALQIEKANKEHAEQRVKEWQEAEARSRKALEEWERVRRQAEDEARNAADTSKRAKEIDDAGLADPEALERDLDARGAVDRERMRRDSED